MIVLDTGLIIVIALAAGTVFAHICYCFYYMCAFDPPDLGPPEIPPLTFNPGIVAAAAA